MAVVIGAATQVSFQNSCVISAQWGFNPNTQRLYCLGEWAPRDDLRFDRPTQTVSVTIYSGDSGSYSTAPSDSCADANTISVSLSPAACGETFASINDQFFVNSYSYSKDDAVMPGQETWSLIRWTDDGINTVAPTYVLRGISEGSSSDSTLTGITFNGTTVESVTGNVSAGGFGKAYTMYQGIVSNVGGSLSTAGETGQGSVSMPYTPLYI
jgi:hypothetical protein